MVFTGVIFDLDGTLADTLADIANSMNRVLQKHGFPKHPVQDYRYMIGRGLENLVTASLPQEHRHNSVVASCLTALIDDYRVNCLVQTHLYEGIKPLLLDLQKKGVRLAVFSNKADDLTQKIVLSLLPDIGFDIIIGARPDFPKKPDPAGALLISEKMGIPPECLIYLGDSDVDMITATKAGMFAVGVLWGFRSGTELRSNGAVALLKSPGELLTLPECNFRDRN
jgi:phosphoglycolate phosphatase